MATQKKLLSSNFNNSSCHKLVNMEGSKQKNRIEMISNKNWLMQWMNWSENDVMTNGQLLWYISEGF